MIKEFRPVIFFLARFLSVYFIGNILYGICVSSFEPRVDPVTHAVTQQVSVLLDVIGWENTIADDKSSPTTIVYYQLHPIIAVYEGCNGINVIIIFVAFLFAFGPWVKEMVWFAILGIIIIHLSNLVRVSLLFFVSLHYPDFLYFVHKYLFTAIIYVIVFVLWIIWVRKIAVKFRPSAT